MRRKADSFSREKAEGRWLIDNLQTACFQRKKALSKCHSLLLFTAVNLARVAALFQRFFFFFWGQVQLWLKFVDWESTIWMAVLIKGIHKWPIDISLYHDTRYIKCPLFICLMKRPVCFSFTMECKCWLMLLTRTTLNSLDFRVEKVWSIERNLEQSKCFI